mgnify:CR=1 FL=1
MLKPPRLLKLLRLKKLPSNQIQNLEARVILSGPLFTKMQPIEKSKDLIAEEEMKMAFTAKDVQTLRQMTGCGMMDCKKALTEADGDFDKAIELLREKGLAKAAKKADRIAAEGLVKATVCDECGVGAIIEVNSETDFVAKNAEFQGLVKNIAEVVAANKPVDLEAALNTEVDGKKLETVIAEASGKIGEKLSFRRFEVLTKTADEVFGAYSHMGGKMTAIVKVANSTEDKARDVAMHVAASDPKYIDRTAIPDEVLDHELSVLKAQAMEENAAAAKPKPENIIEKIG